ncbi:MAG TPA: DUF4386 domain-containing protein [Solirubrobacteraceae bacterium]|nr:DUF4386 domain-containing protein [Solirubrobacteraceae bacterium]
MSGDQKRARWFGVLYLITFVTSIVGLLLYETVLRHPVSYIAGAGHDKQVLLGALLELLLIIANIGTAVVIFPIVRRQSEVLALGYVTARLFECTFILVGIVSMVAIITLRNQAAGAAEGTVAYILAAIKDWTFLLGPGWVVGWGNGLLLGYLMYRSELVPRRACWLGLVGGPLLSLVGTAILLGGNNPSSALHSLQGIATIPEFAWELFLGVYCTFWGFRRSSPILAASPDEPRITTAPAPAVG